MTNLSYIMKSFWAIGCRLRELTKNSQAVEHFIFDLRAERTPGRFFEKLAVRMADYNKRIEGFNASIPVSLFDKKIVGDEFYYLKSAILIGLVNSLSDQKGERA